MTNPLLNRKSFSDIILQFKLRTTCTGCSSTISSIISLILVLPNTSWHWLNAVDPFIYNFTIFSPTKKISFYFEFSLFLYFHILSEADYCRQRAFYSLLALLFFDMLCRQPLTKWSSDPQLKQHLGFWLYWSLCLSLLRLLSLSNLLS